MTMKRRGRALLVAVCAVSAAACGRGETVAGTVRPEVRKPSAR